MAEVLTFFEVFLIFIGTFTALYADENSFRGRSIYISSDLDGKYQRPSASLFNVGDDFQESPTHSTVKSLHLQKRDNDRKGNITTKITRINDTHQQLMVHWVGVGSDVIICLTKSPRADVPSSLYISYDYGETFENKTEFFVLKEGRNSYASLDKFYVHSKYINHIVFSDVMNRVIFTTADSGKTYKRIRLPFSPSEVSFHKDEPFSFLAHDKVNSSGQLWLTRDFGETWRPVQESVKTFYWSGSSLPVAPSNVPNVIPMKGYPYRNDSSLLLFVERMEPSGKSTLLSSSSMFLNASDTKVWMSDIEDVKIVGDFMFVIKAASKNNLDLYVSFKRGPFVKGIFQSELDRLNYNVVDVSEGQIFVAVSHTDTLSNLYSSQTMDDKHIFFALSLERILCFFPNHTWKDSWLTDVTEKSFADLHKVEGLRGIYIASQVQANADSRNIGPEHLLTLITFDRGGEWRPLTPPPIDDDGLPIKCNVNEGCSLHLSQKFSQLYPPTKSVPILSSASAPGIIMATGTIGKSLKGHPRVFLSRDGGLTWRQILKDYYIFNFGDHGGVLVAVKYYRTMSETRELLYSTDEGEKFLSHEFHTEDLKVYGLMTEPGGNTTVFTMFGSTTGHHQWLIIKVDLRNAFRVTFRCYHKAPLQPAVVIDCTAMGGEECLSCMCPTKNSREKLFLIKECSKNKYTAEKLKRCKDCFTCKEDLCNGDPVGRPEFVTRAFRKGKPSRKTQAFWRRRYLCYDCNPDDYKFWSPSSKSGPKMPCILGRKETFERRIAHSNCYNGKDYDRPIKMEICECDLEDFECDFGFERSMALQQCIRNKTFPFNPYEIPATCPPGSFYNRTKGYKKIPGDVCVDGNERKYLPDTLPCPLKEKREFLLVAQRDKINRIDLKDSSVEVLPVLNLKNVIAIEFDMKNNCVYWADITLDIIGRQCFDNGTSKPEILVQSNSSSIEGMALDWVSNNLYFVDGMKREIEVIRTDVRNQGRMRRTILGKKDVKKPRGIAVHPMAGYLYWTDWAIEEPSVSRANLNGSDIRRLFTKPVVEWPNGITIDHIAERIYWVDARQDYIASADLDGKRFKKVVMHDDRVSHPFAVAVFKDFVYWDDWKQSSVFRADKDHGIGVQTIFQNLSGPMDLKIFAHSYQVGTNLCADSAKHNCSHLCMGGPGNTYSCLCPQDMIPIDGDCYCPGKHQPDENGGCPPMNHTCAPNFFMCANKLCISKLWVCDKYDDCGDGSDEVNCTTTCPSSMFECPSGQCIPESWRCDYDLDCNDGADERGCAHPICKSNEFRCKNGLCINKRYRCDFDNDCKDNSDEEDCPVAATNATCKPEEFKCGTACIPNSWRCDGDRDCANNEDETDCNKGACEAWQFQCANKKCIFEIWVCDGEDDCADKSDEVNCTNKDGNNTTVKPYTPISSCSEWTFKCNDGKCIPYWWKCDNAPDCEDRSDEIGCDSNPPPTPSPPSHNASAATTTCKLHHFRCYSGECIDYSWVCDGMKDCNLGEDELNCKDRLNCTANEYMCTTDGSCILLKQICDGKVDCPDGSDEQFCDGDKHLPTPASPSCAAGFFPCDGSRCIPLALVCDQDQTCYDGADESNCQNAKRVYQVLEMGPDPRTINSTSFVLYWWIPLPQDVSFQFLPSIAEMVDGAPQQWKNETWIEGSEYRFNNLKPYTNYNMTVYVRLANMTEAFPPAEYATSTTKAGVPSPPRNVTVVQKSYKSVLVSWLPPKTPNGPIDSYVVGMSPPVPAILTSVSGLAGNVTLKSEFEKDGEYSFWVTALNEALESNSSEVARLVFDSSAYIGGVEELKVASKGSNEVRLSWKAVPDVDGYQIQPMVVFNVSYPRIPALRVGKEATSAAVRNLASKVLYKFEVSGYRKNYFGPVSWVEAQMEGRGLPTIMELKGYVVNGVVDGEGTAVHLSWNLPKHEWNVKWEFGVYYAVRMEDLFEGPRMKVFDSSATVENLAACESYLFGVGLLGPLGVGPIGPPITLTTSFNQRAPPKALTVRPNPNDENSMILQWESSCKLDFKPIGYEILVTEINLNKTSSVTLLPQGESELKHLFKTHYGGRYAISVVTLAPDAVPSAPVYYDAPEIPPPHQLQVIADSNGSFTLMWRESDLPKDIPPSTYRYRVYVGDGPTLNLSSAQRFHTDSSPFVFTNVKGGAIYSFAVQLVTNDGYSSRISEINSYETPPGSFSDKYVFPSNLGSITVPILLPLLTLGAVLGFLFYRHRKLKRNFTNYPNSHYDTRSGSTTFGGAHGLDDEDSPNIRGFSDDEPLVMA